MYPQNNYYYPQPAQAQQTYQALAQMPQVATMPQGLKGRPVSSFEEARAMTIDFDGSTFFFPDLANRRIYTKQINMDGTASLFVYELREQPMNTDSTNANYVTRDEFEKVLRELRLGGQIPQSQPLNSQTPAAADPLERGLAKMY